MSDDGGHNLKPDIPEEEKELREEQGEEIESIQAAPNIREQDLPKPQQPFVPHGNVRGHQRNVSNATDVSSFAASIHGADALPGRLTIVKQHESWRQFRSEGFLENPQLKINCYSRQEVPNLTMF